MITTREESFKTKEKGEKLQLKVRDLHRSYVSEPSLIQSQQMSAHGEDLIIDPKLRPYIPYSFECMYASRPTTSLLIHFEYLLSRLHVMFWQLI